MPIGERFRRHYPGMLPVSVALWRRWLEDHETEFDLFEYNVHVGEGITRTPEALLDDQELAAAITRQFREATQKKIDVVAVRASETWIIEVDDRPGTRVLGQLILYEKLLAQARELASAPTLALVCTRVRTDMLETFTDQGVLVYQLGAPSGLRE